MTRGHNLPKGDTLQLLADKGACEPGEFHAFICQRHGLETHAATNHIQRLIGAGLIKRQVVLTPKGLEKLQALRPKWSKTI